MPKEIIDVVDTAVKIGFGALISGTATYFISKLNNKKEKDKYILEHKIKTIEIASDKLESYFNAISSLFSAIGGAIKIEGISSIYDLDESRLKKILDKDKELQSSWYDRNYAISRFHLFKEPNIIKAIEDIKEFETDLRNIFIINSELISNDELGEKSAQYTILKKELYEKTSNYYGRLNI